MKTKLVIAPPRGYKRGLGQLYKWKGISCPLIHVCEIPHGFIGIEARKKAQAIFANEFEFVNPYTGQPMGETMG